MQEQIFVPTLPPASKCTRRRRLSLPSPPEGEEGPHVQHGEQLRLGLGEAQPVALGLERGHNQGLHTTKGRSSWVPRIPQSNLNDVPNFLCHISPLPQVHKAFFLFNPLMAEICFKNPAVEFCVQTNGLKKGSKCTACFFLCTALARCSGPEASDGKREGKNSSLCFRRILFWHVHGGFRF